MRSARCSGDMRLNEFIKRHTGMSIGEIAVGSLALFGAVCLACVIMGTIMQALGIN